MKKIFLMLSGALLLSACSNDDTGMLSPSNADRDWFALEDSTDPLDHARYELYKDFGISVYYTDVLGIEERGINAYGDPIIHTEMLDPFYNVTSLATGYAYKLSKDRDALLAAVQKLRADIIPGMIPNRYPRAILLVNELSLTDLSDVTTLMNVYEGERTVIISEIDQLASMTEQQYADYSQGVISTIWFNYAMRNHGTEMSEFFAVSENTWPANQLVGDMSRGIYGQLMASPSTWAPIVGTARFWRANWMCFGFLSPATGTTPTQFSQFVPPMSMVNVPGVYTNYKVPSQIDDAIAYIKAVNTHATVELFDAWWKALPENTASTSATPHADYPAGNVWGDLLTAKYKIMSSVIQQIKTETAQ